MLIYIKRCSTSYYTLNSFLLFMVFQKKKPELGHPSLSLIWIFTEYINILKALQRYLIKLILFSPPIN